MRRRAVRAVLLCAAASILGAVHVHANTDSFESFAENPTDDVKTEVETEPAAAAAAADAATRLLSLSVEDGTAVLAQFLLDVGYPDLADQVHRQQHEFPFEAVFLQLPPDVTDHFIDSYLSAPDASVLDIPLDVAQPAAHLLLTAVQHLMVLGVEVREWQLLDSLPPDVAEPAPPNTADDADVEVAMAALRNAVDAGNSQAMVLLAELALFGDRTVLDDHVLSQAGVPSPAAARQLLDTTRALGQVGAPAAELHAPHAAAASDVLALMCLADVQAGHGAFPSEQAAVVALGSSLDSVEGVHVEVAGPRHGDIVQLQPPRNKRWAAARLPAQLALAHIVRNRGEQFCEPAQAMFMALAQQAVSELAVVGPPMSAHVRLWEAWEDAQLTAAQDDVQHTADYLRELAEGGDVDAQVDLAELYTYGGGGGVGGVAVPPDVGQARHYAQQAANANHPLGHVFLAAAALQGGGGPDGNDPDYGAALHHYERAAAMGNADAHNGLGFMYLTGTGVPQNSTKAKQHLLAAADDGIPEAHGRLGVLFLQEGNMTAARQHLQMASDGGSIESSFNLALAYAHGWGGPANCSHSTDLFMFVAHQAEWLSRLPYSVDAAWQSFQDGYPDHALMQYAVAAQLGDSVALDNAGFLLEHNHGQIVFGSGDGDEAGVRPPVAAAPADSGETVAVDVDGNGDSVESAPSAGSAGVEPPHGGVGAVGARLPSWEHRRLNLTYSFYMGGAKAHQTHSALRLGDCFREGWAATPCAPANLSAALHWYETAAAAYDGAAYSAMADVYATGYPGVPQNFSKAWDYLGLCYQVDYLGMVPALAGRVKLLARWLKSAPDVVHAARQLVSFSWTCSMYGPGAVSWTTVALTDQERQFLETNMPAAGDGDGAQDESLFAVDNDGSPPFDFGGDRQSAASGHTSFVRIGPMRLDPMQCRMVGLAWWSMAFVGMAVVSLLTAACLCVLWKRAGARGAPALPPALPAAALPAAAAPAGGDGQGQGQDDGAEVVG